MDEAIIRAHPDPALVHVGRCDGIDHSWMPSLGLRAIAILPDVGRNYGVRPGEVRGDFLPGMSPILCLPKGVGGEEEGVGIDR